ncbi:hypothetical protein KDX01_17165 [Burkholderia vietnamiensis]|uniref:hypothetical protein n=1 Tax=Burkholderia vietnamiensis TaxID=60552 RepID=UPI001B9C7DC7|nr:hypothetical protein [Burkholderia vietnamiensis]MBR7974822.1 hypothetical protein [Burkholderia vietnamiensis]
MDHTTARFNDGTELYQDFVVIQYGIDREDVTPFAHLLDGLVAEPDRSGAAVIDFDWPLALDCDAAGSRDRINEDLQALRAVA